MTNAARKPGERWLEPEDGLGLWAVYECGDDGRTLTVAAHQYRADALLLVHGRGLVEAVEAMREALRRRVGTPDEGKTGSAQMMRINLAMAALVAPKPMEG